jgi:hypothetical protein
MRFAVQIVDFLYPDADVGADSPDRLHGLDWFAGLLKRALRAIACLRLHLTMAPPQAEAPPPDALRAAPLPIPDFSPECTTELNPVNLDWYQFFTVSPPLFLRGSCYV